MLADIVVAKKEEADRVGQSPNPSEEFGGFDVKGLDPIKLATLEEAITSRWVEPNFNLLNQESEKGPWVFEVSPTLVGALQEGLGPSRLSDVVAEWMKSDELRLDRWSADTATYVIESLATLAARAKAEEKIVMLWECL